MLATSRWTMSELRDMGSRDYVQATAWGRRAPDPARASLPKNHEKAGFSAVALDESIDQTRDRVLAGGHIDTQPTAQGGDGRDGPDTRDTRAA